MKLLNRLALGCLLGLCATTVLADTVSVPAAQPGSDKQATDKQAADKADMTRPTSGMTDKKVEAKFGAPLNKSAPVGKPPISKWEYPDYWVYFEKDRVINTVLKVTPVAEPTPAVEAAPVEATPATVVPAASDTSAPVSAPTDAGASPSPDQTDKAGN